MFTRYRERKRGEKMKDAGEVIVIAAALFALCCSVLFFAASVWWEHREKITWHEVTGERMPWYVKLAERILRG
jgi:hypothetical protein